jgi:hypothetical protein
LFLFRPKTGIGPYEIGGSASVVAVGPGWERHAVPDEAVVDSTRCRYFNMHEGVILAADRQDRIVSIGVQPGIHDVQFEGQSLFRKSAIRDLVAAGFRAELRDDASIMVVVDFPQLWLTLAYDPHVGEGPQPLAMHRPSASGPPPFEVLSLERAIELVPVAPDADLW